MTTLGIVLLTAFEVVSEIVEFMVRRIWRTVKNPPKQ